MLDKSMLCSDIDNLIQFDDTLRNAVLTAMKNKYLKMHTAAVWVDRKGLYCTN